MADSKYEKYIKRGTVGRTDQEGITPATLGAPEDWAEIQHRIKWNYISQPVNMEEEPHSHDFEEFLCFLGSNPKDPKDFGAEIEISMGKEGEKQVINTATIVCIPKGMVHCPINFKKIDKPILFCNIYMSPEYLKKPGS
jgi:hypothetical protein